MSRPVYLSTCLPVHHIHRRVKICINNTVNVSTCLPVYLSTCPPCTCKSKTKNVFKILFMCLSFCLRVDQRRICGFNYLKKVVRLCFDILARKCVGNSKVVPNIPISPNKLKFHGKSLSDMTQKRDAVPIFAH